MEVPSLLWSWAGSIRASTAVLSQIGPAPGAVPQVLPGENAELGRAELPDFCERRDGGRVGGVLQPLELRVVRLA